MTRYQEYLAREMDEETLEACEKEAQELEKMHPWEEQDNSDCRPEIDSWLTVVLKHRASEIEYHRAQYCAEMEGLV